MKKLPIAVLMAIFVCSLDAQDSREFTYYGNRLTLFFNGQAVEEKFCEVGFPSEGLVVAKSYFVVDKKLNDNYFQTTYGVKYSVFKNDGTLLSLKTPSAPISLSSFNSNRAAVLENKPDALFGYVDSSGNYAISPRFLDARAFVDGYAPACDLTGLWGIVDVKGSWAVKPEYVVIETLAPGGVFKGQKKLDSEQVIVSAKSGKILFSGNPNLISNSEITRPGPPTAWVILAADKTSPAIYNLDGKKLVSYSNLPYATNSWSFQFVSDGFELITRLDQETDSGEGGTHERQEILRSRHYLFSYSGTPIRNFEGSPLNDTTPQPVYIKKKNYGSSVFYSKAGLVAAGSAEILPLTFSTFGSIDDSICVGIFGMASVWLGDSLPVPISLSNPNYGIRSLFDYKSRTFLVPPSAIQLQRIGPTTWYVQEISGDCYLYDTKQRKVVQKNLPKNLVWMNGQFWLTFQDENSDSKTLSLNAQINDNDVRIRSTPGTSGSVLGTLKKGTHLSVKEIRPEYTVIGQWVGFWMKVEAIDREQESAQKQSGWVFSHFIDFVVGYDGP